MPKEAYVDIKGVRTPIIYSTNALNLLEKETGVATLVLGVRLQSGRAGFRELHQIFWAGLEGGRKKFATRQMPYSMDEVGDLLDDMGGIAVVWMNQEHPVAKAMTEAWKGSFPDKPREDADQSKDPNANAASSTGTTSVTPPLSVVSQSTNSGT